MSFGSKKVGSFKLRGGDAQRDALFESDWDELVIRFDPESHSYRVKKASDQTQNDSTDEERKSKVAKVFTADV